MLITSNDTLEGGTYQYFEFDCLCCASLPSLSRRPVGLGRREIRGDILSGRAHRRRLNETRIMERTKNQNAWIFRHKDEWRKESRGNLEREIKIDPSNDWMLLLRIDGFVFELIHAKSSCPYYHSVALRWRLRDFLLFWLLNVIFTGFYTLAWRV